jgi:hypothetical protein
VADPVVEDGNSGGLLVGGSHEMEVFAEGIHDPQDELLSVCKHFEGPEQVGVHSLVALGGLRHAGYDIWCKGAWFLCIWHW